MKKPETRNSKRETVKIESRDDADRALNTISILSTQISSREARANDKIEKVRAELVDDTADWRAEMAESEAALEIWATENKEELLKEPRSLELNWGTVGFRWTPWKIVAIGKLKIDTILAKIRAAKLTELIRTKEEIDKEKAVNYTPDDLARCGLKKTRKDEFYYEVKKEEVK